MPKKLFTVFLSLVLILLLVIIVLVWLIPPKSLHSHAHSLSERDMFLCGDGNIWRLYGEDDGRPVLKFTGESIEVDTTVRKKNAEDMELYEYLLASCKPESVYIRQDGKVWIALGIAKEKNGEKTIAVSPVEPLPDIPEEQLDSGLSAVPIGFERMRWGSRVIAAFMLRNRGESSYDEPGLGLAVKLGDEWYRVVQSYVYKRDFYDEDPGSFDPGEERALWAELNVEGDRKSGRLIPPGHYRAEFYDDYGGLVNQKGYKERPDDIRFAFEFELCEKNGEYSVEMKGE